MDSPRPRKKSCTPRERVRVTRACDACKKKKLRCTGTQPCASCTNTGVECQFTAGYSRGKLPPIPSSSYADAKEMTPRISDSEERDVSLVSRPVHEEPTLSSRNSPDPGQTDLDGHYVGPSSGVSFLLRAQRRLQESVAGVPKTSSIFDFGDAPLPKYDPYFMILPTRDEARLLVARYFDFAFPTHRFLHQPTVEKWLERFYDNIDDPTEREPGDREVIALLLMVMAQGNQYIPTEDACKKSPVNSAAYFAASEHHLAAEKGAVRLTSIQARLAQAFYLLSQSRINHAWSLFGTIVRLAFALGLHRQRRRDPKGSRPDVIDQEMQKRVFWSAFSLDNYLSAALGRPRSFHIEDIDQDFPTCSNDLEITPDAVLPPSSAAQSVMLAPVSHAKLSKIISGVLKDLYGITRIRLEAQLTIAEGYTKQLGKWQEDIRTFIELPDTEVLKVIYQRQHTVLNLAFAHAQVLLYRPFLLDSPAIPRTSNESTRPLRHRAAENVQKCLESANKILSILRNMCESGRMYSGFWFTHYYSFSAIVVLYVYVIQNHKQPVDIYDKHFVRAQQGQNDLSTCGGSSSFAQRSVLVLEELRREALNRLSKNPGTVPKPADEVITQTKPRFMHKDDKISDGRSPSQQQFNQAFDGRAPVFNSTYQSWPAHPAPLTDFSVSVPIVGEQMQVEAATHMVGMPITGVLESPSSSQGGLPSWAELDSFAMTGLGELGFVFPRGDAYNDWNMPMEG